MQQFPHLLFLEENRIDINSLPHMLQKRLLGFDELHGSLEHTADEDFQQLAEKLADLSLELMEDLEEHFEHQLENNETDEPEKENKTYASSNPVPPAPKPRPVQRPVPMPARAPMTTAKDRDEQIVENVWALHRQYVSPDELQQRGFKASLTGKVIHIGKFCLQKGKYDTCYKITATKTDEQAGHK